MEEEIREVTFELSIAPVSQQARAVAREAFQAEVRKLTAAKEFLFTGDLKVDVEWSIHERVRYEADRAADVDNILKPLLDAMAGPDGIMIDDNQVQSVSCNWIDSYQEEVERLEIRIVSPMGPTLPKKGLRIVQFDQGLCVPFPGALPADFVLGYLDAYAKSLQQRNKCMEEGIDYYSANAFMLLQRPFHRTRLGQFDVVSEGAFRDELLKRL